MKRKKWRRILITAILLIGIAGGAAFIKLHPKNTLPASVNDQLSFSPLVLEQSSKVTADSYRASKVQNNVQTLTFRITLANVHVTATEQVQPDQFTDVADYKSHFLASAFSQYATVQTANGVIYTGPATKLQSQQIGIMLEKGLLVFLYPSEQLTTQQWRIIGDSLTVQNTNN